MFVYYIVVIFWEVLYGDDIFKIQFLPRFKECRHWHANFPKEFPNGGAFYLIKNKMNILESDLEDMLEQMINDKSDHIQLLRLPKNGILFRQFNIKGYGRTDLMYLNYVNHKEYKEKFLNIYVIELKKDLLTVDDISQLCRYVRAVRRFVDDFEYNLNINVRGILIGKGVCKSGDVVFLGDVLSESNIDIFSYQFDYKTGLRFDCVNNGTWSNTNEDFEPIDFKKIFRQIVRESLKCQNA